MTALNERALELAAAAIAAEMNKDDLPAGGWSELCRLSARAAIEAYHASEPDAVAVERELARANEDKAMIWLDAKAALARAEKAETLVAELTAALTEIAELEAPLSKLGDQIFAVTRARSAIRSRSQP